jgi:hypothetical protein
MPWVSLNGAFVDQKTKAKDAGSASRDEHRHRNNRIYQLRIALVLHQPFDTLPGTMLRILNR